MRTMGRAIPFILALTAFCSPLAAQSNRPIYLYALENNGGTNPLHVYAVNPSTGNLAEVPASPFPGGQSPSDLAVDPTGRYLYVINSLSNDITAYVVSASTGTLTPVPGSPFPTGPNPIGISIDPTGRFLYVSSFNVPLIGPIENTLYGYSIDSASGALATLSGFPLTLGNFMSSLRFDSKGNFAYGAEGEFLPILIYRFDLISGALAQVGAVFPATSAAYRSVIDPSDRFLYATQPETNGRVDALSIDPASGTLNEVTGSPYNVGVSPMGQAIDPAGKFLYAVNFDYPFQTTSPPSQYAGSVSGFTIDPVSGALTSMPGSPFAAGINPESTVVDPTGHFLYVYASDYPDPASYLSYASVLGYSLDSTTGIPTPLAASPWRSALQHSNGNKLAISFGPVTTSNPVPMISSLSPSSVTTGSGDFALLVDGVNFVPGATVYFGGMGRQTTYVNSTQLQARILASDIASGGTGVVYVFNPLPGGGASASVGVNVYNPAPLLSSISPSSVTAGDPGFTLMVNGSNFISNSTVNFNGTPRATTFVSASELTIGVASADIASQGTASIDVTNPATNGIGGGTSDPATLTILASNIQPAVSALSPSSATAGGPGFTLAVTGSGFISGAVVSFNLVNVPTTYTSSTQLRAQIPASAIAQAGFPVVVVTNPNSSVPLVATFTVNNPPPGAGTIYPPSTSAGNAALMLSVTGTNFTDASVVLVNGSPRNTVFVSSTQLTATLLPSDFATGGTLSITVTSPSPGGGTTSAIPFVVTDYTVTPAAGSSTVSAGQPATFGFAVAPSNGAFNNAVTFTATNLPPMSAGSFSPSAVVTPGSAPLNVTLSITTTPHSAAFLPAFPEGAAPGRPLAGLLIFLLAGFGMASGVWFKRARRLALPVALACLVLTAAGLVACGGAGAGGSSSAPQINPATGTPAGTYTILVNATSGGVSHSTNVILTVN
jgi:6-phosphogluconolactonase (cycloisomerase 2 family)